MNIEELKKLKEELEYVRKTTEYKHQNQYVRWEVGVDTPKDLGEITEEHCIDKEEVDKKIKTDEAVALFEKLVEDYVREANKKGIDFDHIEVTVFSPQYYINRAILESTIEKMENLPKEAILDDVAQVYFLINGYENSEIVEATNLGGVPRIRVGEGDNQDLEDLNSKFIEKTDAIGYEGMPWVKYSEFKEKLSNLGYTTYIDFDKLIDIDGIVNDDIKEGKEDKIIIDFTNQRKNVR